MKAFTLSFAAIPLVLLCHGCKKDEPGTTTPPHQDTTVQEPYVPACFVTHYTEWEKRQRITAYKLTYDSNYHFRMIEDENRITGSTNNPMPVSIIYKDKSIVIVRYGNGLKNTYDSLVTNRAGQVVYHYYTDSTTTPIEYLYNYNEQQQLVSIEQYPQELMHYYKWLDGDLLQDSVDDGRTPTLRFSYYTDHLASPAGPNVLRDMIEYGIVRIKSKHLLKSGGGANINGFDRSVLDNRYSFFGDGQVATDTIITTWGDTAIRTFQYLCK